MTSNQQPIFASLNLASFYKIELSCQRFINLGTRMVKIGGVLNQNIGALKRLKRGDRDRQTIFAKQIFGPNRDEVGYCLCGLRKGKNPHTIQVMIRDNENLYWTTICGICLMEYMGDAMQMSRMGLINLPISVLHVWYIPYISRLLMCDNEFVFRSIYGYVMTFVILWPGPVKFESRRGLKHLELDGNKVSGIMLPKSVDKIQKYDIAFLPMQYTRYGSSIFYSTSLNRRTSQIPQLPYYRDDPFKVFISQLRHNQFIGIGSQEFFSEKELYEFLKLRSRQVLTRLKKLRREQAKLILSQKPETLLIFVHLIREKTYKRIARLTDKYKALKNWTNSYLFVAQKLNNKRSLYIAFINFQNISFHLQQFRHQKSVIQDFISNPYGRYDTVTTMKVRPKPKNVRSYNNNRTFLKKLKRMKRLKPGRLKSGNESLGKQKRGCIVCGQKRFIGDIEYNKVLNSSLKKWAFQHNSNFFVRYSLNSNSTLFGKDLTSFVPSFFLSEVERNWSYKNQTVSFQESEFKKVVPIYNNYWEIASQPMEKSNRQCISTFFRSKRPETFAELDDFWMEFNFNENTEIYEEKFLVKPRNFWHKLDLLPFNLISHSHTSWKEKFGTYSPPAVENVNMLKFMLHNLSDVIIKYNMNQSEEVSPTDFTAELFEGVFMGLDSIRLKKFKIFFNLYIYNTSIDSKLARSMKFFSKKFMKFYNLHFPVEFPSEYSKQIKINNNKNSSVNRWQTISFIKSEILHRNIKVLADYSTVCQFRKQARNRMFQTFQRSRNRFEWMVLSNIPILPISLRPLVTVGEGENSILVRSEINTLYTTIVYRAQLLLQMYKNRRRYPIFLEKLNRLLLQQSVEELFGNPYSRFSPESSQKLNSVDSSGLSLLDRLKGKYGRLRRQLLGKRVDYSGRSVIVVGPLLELNMCALPVELGFQIFQPLLIHALSALEIAPNLSAAKRMISTSQPRVKECLQNLAQNEIVLLNRAPTLHRMNFQTFYPIITEHKTILLHPLVCSAFNADFDGDQMAVHLPLSIESRLEARIIMMASHNLLSPSTGSATILPTQDMILGCYYLTLEPPVKYLGNERYMYTLDEIDHYLTSSNFNLHDWVWLQYNGIDIKKKAEILPNLEMRIYKSGVVWSIFPKRQKIDNYMNSSSYSFLGTTLGRIIFNKVLGFGSFKDF